MLDVEYRRPKGVPSQLTIADLNYSTDGITLRRRMVSDSTGGKARSAHDEVGDVYHGRVGDEGGRISPSSQRPTRRNLILKVPEL